MDHRMEGFLIGHTHRMGDGQVRHRMFPQEDRLTRPGPLAQGVRHHGRMTVPIPILAVLQCR